MFSRVDGHVVGGAWFGGRNSLALPLGCHDHSLENQTLRFDSSDRGVLIREDRHPTTGIYPGASTCAVSSCRCISSRRSVRLTVSVTDAMRDLPCSLVVGPGRVRV